MKLDKLVVHRLPGIPSGFTMETDADVSIIIGPNGSGKSSLTRAVRHMLWSEGKPISPFSVEAFFSWEGAQWKAIREEGMQTRWMREGQATSPPDLPAEHVALCYEMGILELVLPAGGEVEQQLAAIINNEMSGGVNLSQISESLFSLSGRLASNRKTALNTANANLSTLLRQQKQLAEQEAQLVEKQQDLERTKNSAALFSMLEKLKSYNTLINELETVRFKIDKFDEGQDKVQPDDLTTLNALTSQHLKKSRRAQEFKAEISAQLEKLKELKLPDNMVDPELLSLQVSEADALQKNLNNLHENRARQEAILQELLLEFDPQADGDTAGPKPGRETYSELIKVYSRLAKNQALDESLEEISGSPELKIQESTPEADRAYEKLRLWLESPDTGGGSINIVGTILGLAIFGVGWVLQSSDTQLIGLTTMVFGVGLAGYSLFQFIKSRSKIKRQQALTAEVEKELRDAGIPLQTTLTKNLGVHLVEDQVRTDAANHTRKTLLDNFAHKDQLQKQRTEQSQLLLDKLRQDHGMALDREMPDLLNLLNVIPRFRSAQDESTSLSAAIAHKQQELDEVLATLNVTFEKLGFEPATSTTESSHLLEKLDLQLSATRLLTEQQDRDRNDLKLVQLDLEEIDTRLTGFWNRLGLLPTDNDYQVRKLVDQIPQWVEAQNEESRLSQQIDFLELAFKSTAGIPDPRDGKKLTDEELDTRLNELQQEAEARQSIASDITRIETLVGEARNSQDVAEARIQTEAAQALLQETRQHERDNALGRLLLTDVQQTYHHTSRPKVLARASDNFKNFTQGLYELRIEPGDHQAGCFVAYDGEKKENRGLAELSDGTRAQLLLAVRLAFISENEKSAKPPIFLDESLTSSDPQRFTAIASQLAQWAQQENRQVYYLSSNPNDAKAWESVLAQSGLPAPETFDLETARNQVSGQTIAFDYEPPEVVPSPDQMTAAEYARLLAVPALDPWLENTESHLWYLLQDDLQLLYRLREAEAPTLGRFLMRKEDMVVLGKMTSADVPRLLARGHCLDAFFKNWRIGRSRPVTAEALVSSGAISDKYLDQCKALLKDVRGDSGQFLEGLRDKKVKGFRKNKLEAVEKFFQEENYLDPRDVLAEDELLGLVQSLVVSEIEAGFLETSGVRKLVLSWIKLIA